MLAFSPLRQVRRTRLNICILRTMNTTLRLVLLCWWLLWKMNFGLGFGHSYDTGAEGFTERRYRGLFLFGIVETWIPFSRDARSVLLTATFFNFCIGSTEVQLFVFVCSFYLRWLMKLFKHSRKPSCLYCMYYVKHLKFHL